MLQFGEEAAGVGKLGLLIVMGGFDKILLIRSMDNHRQCLKSRS